MHRGPNEGLTNKAKKIKGIKTHRYPDCARMWSSQEKRRFRNCCVSCRYERTFVRCSCHIAGGSTARWQLSYGIPGSLVVWK